MSARTSREHKPPKDFKAVPLVEVPQATLLETAQLAWPEVLAMAEAAGWRVETRSDYLWCAPKHALLREGYDEMRGIPVLLYQNW
jgi:hypothetical protein